MIRGLRDTGAIQRRQEPDGRFHRRRRKHSELARGQTQKCGERQGMKDEYFAGIHLGPEPAPRFPVGREFRPERVDEEFGIREYHFVPGGMGNLSATRNAYAFSSSFKTAS